MILRPTGNLIYAVTWALVRPSLQWVPQPQDINRLQTLQREHAPKTLKEINQTDAHFFKLTGKARHIVQVPLSVALCVIERCEKPYRRLQETRQRPSKSDHWQWRRFEWPAMQNMLLSMWHKWQDFRFWLKSYRWRVQRRFLHLLGMQAQRNHSINSNEDSDSSSLDHGELLIPRDDELYVQAQRLCERWSEEGVAPFGGDPGRPF